jgi:hypothetical protein
MSKTKLERGRFYGQIKKVTVRRGGRVVGQMPFGKLVEEVADDPDFSVAQHVANPSSADDIVEVADEAIRLLKRTRTYLQGGARVEKLKDEIDEFLERQASS